MRALNILGMCLLAAGGVPLAVQGQINPATAFYWENPFYINPASVNLDYAAYFTLAARKQWTSFPGSPSTLNTTGAFYAEEYRTQIGYKIVSDRIGYLNTTDISLAYAYTAKLSWNSFLNLGVSGAFQSQSVDRSKVELGDVSDPVAGNAFFKGTKEWNAGIGIEYVYDKKLTVGISGRNFLSFLKKEPHIWGGTNYLYGRYRTRSVERSFDLEVGFCVHQYEDDTQVEGMLTWYLNRDRREELLQLSLLGRSTGEAGFLVGVKLVSDLKFLLAFDYNFHGVSGNTFGTFELMVSYPLHKSSTCRSEWDL